MLLDDGLRGGEILARGRVRLDGGLVLLAERLEPPFEAAALIRGLQLAVLGLAHHVLELRDAGLRRGQLLGALLERVLRVRQRLLHGELLAQLGLDALVRLGDPALRLRHVGGVAVGGGPRLGERVADGVERALAGGGGLGRRGKTMLELSACGALALALGPRGGENVEGIDDAAVGLGVGRRRSRGLDLLLRLRLPVSVSSTVGCAAVDGIEY